MGTQPAITDDQIRALLPGCRQGDMQAVEALYGLYADRLYRYALARVGERDDAADLAGDAFLRVIANIARFEADPRYPAAAFSGWVYRIAANLITDYRRAERRMPRALLDEDLTPGSLSAAEGDPHWSVERRERAMRVAKALDALTEEQRLVVIAKFGEEMTNLEIGDLLGKTEGAVKSLQHRGLRVLARVLRRDT